MQRLGIALLVLLGLGFVGYRVVLPRAWSQPASTPLSLEGEPRQSPIEQPERIQVDRDGREYVVEKLFDYEISGEVLSASSYDVSWTTDFSDVDVALIWGPRRARFKELFTFSQMGRWLFWRFDESVSAEDRRDVALHVSNNHLIPSEKSKHVASAFRMIREGDQVRLTGSLVRVLGPGGHPLASSSVSRDDSGDGACEVVWVDELQVGSRIFR